MDPELFKVMRLVVAVVMACMAGVACLPRNASEEQQKAAGWAAVIVGIFTFIFIKPVITVLSIIALLFLTYKLGPSIISWSMGAVDGIRTEIEIQRGEKPSSSALGLPGNAEDVLKEALESGDPEVLKETVEWALRNGNSRRIECRR